MQRADPATAIHHTNHLCHRQRSVTEMTLLNMISDLLKGGVERHLTLQLDTSSVVHGFCSYT